MIQWLTDLMQDTASLRIDYQSGAFLSADKTQAFVRYNTGDLVWFKLVDNQWQVTGIDTHDDSVRWRA